jgi:uncharacterized protein (TIGR02271 family)
MVPKKTAVFGIYPERSGAERGVDTLKAAGFRNTDISVLFPEGQGTKDFAHEKHTKAPEGAATGAGTGAVLGGGLGWLVGIGALAIPGIGPFIAAGPIVAALAGVGVGGAVGGITGALIGMGIPEYEAKRYEGHVKNGGILLSVHSDNSEWTSKAKDILKATGAKDIASTGEAISERKSGAGRRDETSDDTRQPREAMNEHRIVSQQAETHSLRAGDKAEQRMQLLGEDLDVRKERVQKGEVRVRKEAVTEAQHLQVPVTREELVINRYPAGQSDPTATVGNEREMRIPLSEEQVRIEKRPVVRDEVVVGKRNVDDIQRVSEDVRREELRIDEQATGQSSVEDVRERKRSA